MDPSTRESRSNAIKAFNRESSRDERDLEMSFKQERTEEAEKRQPEEASNSHPPDAVRFMDFLCSLCLLLLKMLSAFLFWLFAGQRLRGANMPLGLVLSLPADRTLLNREIAASNGVLTSGLAPGCRVLSVRL
ncbi:MAG: hypothetical protein IT428_29235 [Planctomycetaceae bacterium]|nr:hypothetical protein [Planctomycetaceae bacterium]